MNRLMAVAAFIVLAAFLSVLLIHVPRLDLALVIGITLLLAGWDAFSGMRKGR